MKTYRIKFMHGVHEKSMLGYGFNELDAEIRFMEKAKRIGWIFIIVIKIERA